MSLTFTKKIWFRCLTLLLIFQIPLNDFSAYAGLNPRQNNSTIPLVSGFGSSDSGAEFRRREFRQRMNKLFIQKHLSGHKISSATGFGTGEEVENDPEFERFREHLKSVSRPHREWILSSQDRFKIWFGKSRTLEDRWALAGPLAKHFGISEDDARFALADIHFYDVHGLDGYVQPSVGYYTESFEDKDEPNFAIIEPLDGSDFTYAEKLLLLLDDVFQKYPLISRTRSKFPELLDAKSPPGRTYIRFAKRKSGIDIAFLGSSRGVVHHIDIPLYLGPSRIEWENEITDPLHVFYTEGRSFRLFDRLVAHEFAHSLGLVVNLGRLQDFLAKYPGLYTDPLPAEGRFGKLVPELAAIIWEQKIRDMADAKGLTDLLGKPGTGFIASAKEARQFFLTLQSTRMPVEYLAESISLFWLDPDYVKAHDEITYDFISAILDYPAGFGSGNKNNVTVSNLYDAKTISELSHLPMETAESWLQQRGEHRQALGERHLLEDQIGFTSSGKLHTAQVLTCVACGVMGLGATWSGLFHVSELILEDKGPPLAQSRIEMVFQFFRALHHRRISLTGASGVILVPIFEYAKLTDFQREHFERLAWGEFSREYADAIRTVEVSGQSPKKVLAGLFEEFKKASIQSQTQPQSRLSKMVTMDIAAALASVLTDLGFLSVRTVPGLSWWANPIRLFHEERIIRAFEDPSESKVLQQETLSAGFGAPANQSINLPEVIEFPIEYGNFFRYDSDAPPWKISRREALSDFFHRSYAISTILFYHFPSLSVSDIERLTIVQKLGGGDRRITYVLELLFKDGRRFPFVMKVSNTPELIDDLHQAVGMRTRKIAGMAAEGYGVWKLKNGDTVFLRDHKVGKKFSDFAEDKSEEIKYRSVLKIFRRLLQVWEATGSAITDPHTGNFIIFWSDRISDWRASAIDLGNMQIKQGLKPEFHENGRITFVDEQGAQVPDIYEHVSIVELAKIFNQKFSEPTWDIDGSGRYYAVTYRLIAEAILEHFPKRQALTYLDEIAAYSDFHRESIEKALQELQVDRDNLDGEKIKVEFNAGFPRDGLRNDLRHFFETSSALRTVLFQSEPNATVHDLEVLRFEEKLEGDTFKNTYRATLQYGKGKEIPLVIDVAEDGQSSAQLLQAIELKTGRVSNLPIYEFGAWRLGGDKSVLIREFRPGVNYVEFSRQKSAETIRRKAIHLFITLLRIWEATGSALENLHLEQFIIFPGATESDWQVSSTGLGHMSVKPDLQPLFRGNGRVGFVDEKGSNVQDIYRPVSVAELTRRFVVAFSKAVAAEPSLTFHDTELFEIVVEAITRHFPRKTARLMLEEIISAEPQYRAPVLKALSSVGFGATVRWQTREKGVLLGLLSSSLGASAVIVANSVLHYETNILALTFSAAILADVFLHLMNFMRAQHSRSNIRAKLRNGAALLLFAAASGVAIRYQALGWFLFGTYLVVKIGMLTLKMVKHEPPELSQKARWGLAIYPMVIQPVGLPAIIYFGPVFFLLSAALTPIFSAFLERFFSVKRLGKMQWLGAVIVVSALLASRYNQLGSLATLPVIFILLFVSTQAVGGLILKFIQTDLPKMSSIEQMRIAYATSVWPIALAYTIFRILKDESLEMAGVFSGILSPLNSQISHVAILIVVWALVRMASRLTEFRTVKYTDASTTNFLRSTQAFFGIIFIGLLSLDPTVLISHRMQFVAASFVAFGIWLFVRSPALTAAKELVRQSKNGKLSKEKAYAVFSNLAEAITQYLYLRHRQLKPKEEAWRLENIKIRLSSATSLGDLDNGVNHKRMYEILRKFARSFPINFEKHGALAWALGGNSATERWLGIPGVYSEFEESEAVLNSEASSLYSKLKLVQASVSRRKLAPFLKRVRHDRDLAGTLRVWMNSEMFAYRLNKQERMYLQRLLNEDFWVRPPEQFALKTGFNQAAFLAYLLYYLEDKSLLWNQGNALSGLLSEESQGRLSFDNIGEREQFRAELGALAETVHGIIPHRGLKRRDWKRKLERYSPTDVENYILRRRSWIKSDRTFQIDKFRTELLHIEENTVDYNGKKINTWMYQVPVRSNDQELVALFAPYTPHAVEQFEKYRGKAIEWTAEQAGGKPWIFVVVPWADYRESAYVARVKKHYESGRLAGGIHQAGDDVYKEYTFSTIAPDIRVETRELIRREIGSKKRILSIGPGRFLLERELVEDGHEVSTVELSEVLSKDSDGTGGIQKFTGDAQHLERVLPMSIPADEQRKFDAIVLSESIAYFDGEDLTQKLGAFLKHNGRVFITTYPGDHGRPFWGYRFTPLSELTHWLSEAGFDIKTRAFYRLAGDLTQMPVPITEVDEEASADIYLVSAGMSDFARKLNLPESPVSFSIRQATIRQLLSRRPEFNKEFDRDLGSLLEIARILAGRFEQRDLEDGFQRELTPPVIQLEPGGAETHHDLSKGWSIRMVGREDRYDMSIIFTETVSRKEVSSVVAIAKSQPLLPSVAGDSVAGTFLADAVSFNEDLSIDLLGVSSQNAGIVAEQLEAKILATLDKFFVFGDRVIPGTLTGLSFENLSVNIVVEYVRPGIYHFRVIARDSLDPEVSDAHRTPILEGHFQNTNKVSGFGLTASISETMYGGTTLLITRDHAEAVYSLMNLTDDLQNTILPSVSNIVMVWEERPEEAKKWAQALARKFRLTDRRNLYHSGSFGLLKEEAVLSLLKKDLFHFGDISDLPLSIQPLRSADSYFVPDWFVWVARQRMVKTAA